MGDEESLAVCRVMKRDICSVLQSCIGDGKEERSYLHSLLLLSLCRFASLADCVECLFSGEGASECAAIVFECAVGTIENVIVTPSAHVSDIKSYERHCFGLYFTLMVSMINVEVCYCSLTVYLALTLM
jgi:hypothetical protein